MRALAGVVASMAVVMSSCTLESIGGWRSASALQQGAVRVTLEVDPDVVTRPDTVVATLTYTNTSTRAVDLVSSYGCVAFADVFRGSVRVPFPATEYACTTAITRRELHPGEPLRVRWELAVGGATGVDAPAGTYRFRARLNTHGTTLEHEFEIR